MTARKKPTETSRIVKAFRGAYEFLGNGYRCHIRLIGAGSRVIVAWSAEHAYQAPKGRTPEARETVAVAAKPFGKDGAKQRGRATLLRDGWEDVKIPVMLYVLRQKFGDPALARLLLATGDMELQEGNTWGDEFWGMVDGKGENNLGKLLMQVRDELRVVYGQ